MIRAILMDFNGVIINDEPIQMKAYQAVLAERGIDLTEDDYYACLGMDDKAFLKAAFGQKDKEVTPEEIVEISAAKTLKWREIIEKNVPLFEGAENFVCTMSRHFAVGIVSMAKREEINFVLERTGLAGSVSAVISAENVSDHKPAPECYLKGLSAIDAVNTSAGKHALAHAECVVIEDSPQGIQAGKAAGMFALGIPNTVSAERLRESGADAVSKGLFDWSPDSFRSLFK